MPRNRPRERNIVVLALAQVVREAIEADEVDDPEQPAPRRRMADPITEVELALRISVASTSAA
jgi:hypothetical protein